MPDKTRSGANLGTHTATQNLNLADKLLVGQNTATDAVSSTGQRVYSEGQVSIGTVHTLDGNYNNNSYAGLD
ncbi:hypothetical protein [Hymenobacter guriensis]|uniref:Uncharacterized protein n=1 Tax=Hymenobacter guriensis TaxID=2793065 RepID=A0ABS0L2Q6_9BACT|nr:hypothetical protein [Hymenobacter guriensis]MBG8554361.1 hypothetical protein [Hymenobacter guriensis]